MQLEEIRQSLKWPPKKWKCQRQRENASRLVKYIWLPLYPTQKFWLTKKRVACSPLTLESLSSHHVSLGRQATLYMLVRRLWLGPSPIGSNHSPIWNPNKQVDFPIFRPNNSQILHVWHVNWCPSNNLKYKKVLVISKAAIFFREKAAGSRN